MAAVVASKPTGSKSRGSRLGSWARIHAAVFLRKEGALRYNEDISEPGGPRMDATRCIVNYYYIEVGVQAYNLVQRTSD